MQLDGRVRIPSGDDDLSFRVLREQVLDGVKPKAVGPVGSLRKRTKREKKESEISYDVESIPPKTSPNDSRKGRTAMRYTIGDMVEGLMKTEEVLKTGRW